MNVEEEEERDFNSVSGSQPLFQSQDTTQSHTQSQVEGESEEQLSHRSREGQVPMVEKGKESQRHIPLHRVYKNEVQHSAQKVPVEVFLQLFDLYRSQLMISQSKIKSTKEWSAGISSGDESCESGTILLKERPRRGNIDCKDFNSVVLKRPDRQTRGNLRTSATNARVNSSSTDNTDNIDFLCTQNRRLRSARNKINASLNNVVDLSDSDDDGANEQGIGERVKGWLNAKLGRRKQVTEDSPEVERPSKRTRTRAKVFGDSEDGDFEKPEETGKLETPEKAKGSSTAQVESEEKEKAEKQTSVLGGIKSGLNKMIGVLGKRTHRENPQNQTGQTPLSFYKKKNQETSTKTPREKRPEKVDLTSDIEVSDTEVDQREPLKLQSRQENLLSTSLSRDFTKQPGNENLQSSSLPRKVSAKDTVECPICMEYFPSENIENHASTCYGPVERVTTRSQNESEERFNENINEFIQVNESLHLSTGTHPPAGQGSAKAKVYSAWSAACEKLNNTDSRKTNAEQKEATSEFHQRQSRKVNQTKFFGNAVRAFEDVAEESRKFMEEYNLKGDPQRPGRLNNCHELNNKQRGNDNFAKEAKQTVRDPRNNKSRERMSTKENGAKDEPRSKSVAFKEKEQLNQWMSDNSEDERNESMSFLDQYVPDNQIKKTKKRKNNEEQDKARKQFRRNYLDEEDNQVDEEYRKKVGGNYLDEEDSIDIDNGTEKCFLCGRSFPAGAEYERHVHDCVDAQEAANTSHLNVKVQVDPGHWDFNGNKLYAPAIRLFLYSYESEFLDNVIRSGHRKLARSFNSCFQYTDDLIVFNNEKFEGYVKEIYRFQLTVESQQT